MKFCVAIAIITLLQVFAFQAHAEGDLIEKEDPGFLRGRCSEDDPCMNIMHEVVNAICQSYYLLDCNIESSEDCSALMDAYVAEGGHTDELKLSTTRHLLAGGAGRQLVSANCQDICSPFLSNEELHNAVEDYYSDEPDKKADVVAKYCEIEAWDVGAVTNFDQIFHYSQYGGRAYAFLRTKFDADLSKWNTGSAETMRYMFDSAEKFNNGGNALTWDVGNVKDMAFMFFDAQVFNADLSNWDVSQVTNMLAMFSNAYGFNADLSNWDVKKVESMEAMFAGAFKFNADISNWDVRQVTDMSRMFYDAQAFDQNLCAWGPKLNGNVVVVGMFWQTSCEPNGDPNLYSSPPGPLCAICTGEETS